MSSSPAAPSRASVTAWASTSASDWPRSPFSNEISTPPRTSLRRASASAKAWASTPRPTRKFSRVPRGVRRGRPRAPPVWPLRGRGLRGGQLDVRLLPRDHGDAPAGVLDEGGVVGRGAQTFFRGGVYPAQQFEPEGLWGLDGAELRAVEGRRDRAVLGDLYGVGDGDRGDYAVHVLARRRDDSSDQVRGNEAAGAVVDQDNRSRVFLTEAKTAAGREGAGLAGIGTAGELPYAGAVDQVFDAVTIADGVDLADCRAVFEGLQGVIEGRSPPEVYELLRPAHPAAGPPGEH